LPVRVERPPSVEEVATVAPGVRGGPEGGEASPRDAASSPTGPAVRGRRQLWQALAGIVLVAASFMAWQVWQVMRVPSLSSDTGSQPAQGPAQVQAEPPHAEVATASPETAPSGRTPKLAGVAHPVEPTARAEPTAVDRVAPESSPARSVTALTDGGNPPAQLVRSQAQQQLQKAWSALQQGDAVRAQTLYQQVLINRPGDPDATLGLAVSLHRQQQLEAAWLAYHRSLQVWPDNETARAGMLAILAESDPDTAESRLKELIQLRPRDGAAQASLGGLMGKQGRWAEALGPLSMAQALAPDSMSHAHNLAVAFDHLHRHAEAVAMYRLTLQLGATGALAQETTQRIADLTGGAQP
jgi:Flp pilus assembly protein TadD